MGGRRVKNAIWSVVAIVALGTVAATPAYAHDGSSGLGFLCKIPVIGQYLCPPAPGDGGGGGASVPEPASLAILAAGAGMVAAARRRRRKQ
jgi:hypothetical protein